MLHGASSILYALVLLSLLVMGHFVLEHLSKTQKASGKGLGDAVHSAVPLYIFIDKRKSPRHNGFFANDDVESHNKK